MLSNIRLIHPQGVKMAGKAMFSSLKVSSSVRSTMAIAKFQRNSYRSYSSESSGETKPEGKGFSKLPLFVLGAAAIGLTYYNLNNPSKPPKAAIDPVSGPEFSDKEVSVIFVLGGPGAGKGTQCAKLVKDYGFIHLSAGDLLRAEQNRQGSTYGELIAKCIKDGEIVPMEVTIALLKNAISENYKAGSTRFLVDGFPRKMDQAISFEEVVVKSQFTLFFDCPEQVMLKRLLERGKTSGRADDNIDSIKKRFKTFVETSYPVVEYYKKQDKVCTVYCDEPVDTVYGKVVEALKAKGISPK